MPYKPHPGWQNEIKFPTPNLDDVLFWEYTSLSREDELTLSTSTKYAYGTSHPKPDKYPDHELVFLLHDPDHGADGNDSKRYRAYYAVERAAQDDYNFAAVIADIGGQKFDAVTRTYIIKREDYDESTPAMGAAMTTDPGGMFASGYVLAGRSLSRIGQQELDSLYVAETRLYIKKVNVYSVGYDEATFGTLGVTEILLHRGEVYSGTAIEDLIADPDNAVWGVSATTPYIVVEGRQLSANWYLVTEREVVPADKTVTDTNFGGVVLQSYQTYHDVSWPLVLGNDGSYVATPGDLAGIHIEIMDWVDKDGNARNYPRPMFARKAYHGPTRVLIVEEWSATAPDLGTEAARPISLQGSPIVYNSPYLSLSIRPCLHPDVTVTCNTAASDPTWGLNSGSGRTYPATALTDWPESFVLVVQTQPFRGGYLTRHVTAYRPETSV